MPELLKGYAAIITGSSRGIGRAIALAFAENGADLVIHGTKEGALQELQSQIRDMGVRCEYVAGDIGQYETAQRLADTCMAAYGKIDVLVNNAGINSRKTAHPNAAVCYGVSKAGINSLTQKLAYDLAPHGIRVNAVCPGPIETDMSLQWTEEYREKVFSSIPLRRLGTGADVANVAVFLASEMAAFVVGESINVNGGKYMN